MIINVAILLILVIIMAVLNYFFQKDKIREGHYILHGSTDSPAFLAFKSGLSFYLLINQIVPVGIVVNTEIVKIFLTYFIEQDAELHSTISD